MLLFLLPVSSIIYHKYCMFRMDPNQSLLHSTAKLSRHTYTTHRGLPARFPLTFNNIWRKTMNSDPLWVQREKWFNTAIQKRKNRKEPTKRGCLSVSRFVILMKYKTGNSLCSGAHNVLGFIIPLVSPSWSQLSL